VKKGYLADGMCFVCLATTYSPALAVPSALERFTAEFEMGSGGGAPPESPGKQSTFHDLVYFPQLRALINESNQADRAISTGKLHVLPHFHTQPINVVVYNDSQGRTCFEVGFPLRCLQRLSLPHIATLHCRWRDNRSTRGASIPVLSY
jgi:hypothetical protein